SKEVLQREMAHDGCVLGVDTWVKDGLAVSCGLDKTVRLWERVRELGSDLEEGGRYEANLDGSLKIEVEDMGQTEANGEAN
ncbi:MAG: hypothetical protein Q9173_005860, partial [Seirophora scorigena]